MDLEDLRQIQSLNSLPDWQLARVARNLRWYQYAPGQLILPHQVLLDWDGLVYEGNVQVVIVNQGHRQTVDHLRPGETIGSVLRISQSRQVELRATEATTLCLLPVNWREFLSDAEHTLPRTPRRRALANDRVAFSILLISVAVLCGFLVWRTSTPVKAVLSDLAYGLAARCLDANDEEKALSLLSISLDLNPNNARAHNDLGYIHYRQGRHDLALLAFQQAVAVDGDLAVAQNNLGVGYLENRQLDVAREALERAVALNPESAAAWLNLGQTEHQAGTLENAVRAYRTALRLNPHLTAAQVNLGLIYYEVGLLSKSQHYLELALDAQPNMSQAKITLGAVAMRLGDRERAWRELHSANSDRADDPLLQFYLALWYEGAGLDEAAIHTLKKVLALQPHPDLAALARSHLRVLQSMGPADRLPSAEAMKGE